MDQAEQTRLRYAAIVESSQDAIISKNLDGVITTWNAAAQQMFGYTEKEAIGQPITLIIPPELYDEEHDILTRLRAGERIEHYETRLHSSRLELLGFEAAVRGLCDELCERHGVTIDLHVENISTALLPEIALCLYRVLQEALQNVLKHSASRQAHVSIDGEFDNINLSVKDSGAGFDSDEVVRGLGLTSMNERLKLVGGQFSIHSQPGRGTTIHAVVPRRFSLVP